MHINNDCIVRAHISDGSCYVNDATATCVSVRSSCCSRWKDDARQVKNTACQIVTHVLTKLCMSVTSIKSLRTVRNILYMMRNTPNTVRNISNMMRNTTNTACNIPKWCATHWTRCATHWTRCATHWTRCVTHLTRCVTHWTLRNTLNTVRNTLNTVRNTLWSYLFPSRYYS